jgi:hypothetical protein
MKVTTNTQIIEHRTKWAKRIAPVSMLLLLGGLITNIMSATRPELFQITMVLLGVGVVSAIISTHLVNNWVREPRADQLLTYLLEKFGNDYILFNYTGPISHVLVAPNGVYAVVVKSQSGQITVNGRRVTRSFDWRRLLRLFADDSLGSPIRDAEGQVERLKKFLSQRLGPEEIPPVLPLLLFSNKNVQLSVQDPAVPTMASSEFKTFLREQGKKRNVSQEQRRKLVEILGGQ